MVQQRPYLCLALNALLCLACFDSAGDNAPTWDVLAELYGEDKDSQSVKDLVDQYDLKAYSKGASGGFGTSDSSYSLLYSNNRIETIVLRATLPPDPTKTDRIFTHPLPGGLDAKNGRSDVIKILGEPIRPDGNTWHHDGLKIWVFFNQDESGINQLYVSAIEPAARNHGLVGLRPIPADEDGTKHNHGGSWEGMPTFEQQKGNYPFVAEHIDTLFSWVPDGDFKTKRVFFEYYWGLSKQRDELDPAKNFLIKTIKQWEDRGGEVVHILICREARLAVDRGWKDAELGPFKEDGRILSAKDIRDIRKLFKDAHAQKLTKHDDYKLIMMVEEPSFFATDPEAQKIIKMTSGVAYEAHQFNRHWPLETGWSKPGPVVKAAKWTLEQNLEYIFYFGPILWKQDKRYKPHIERDWLKIFWAEGLPKHHPNMHYYLNTFPHHTGRGRPVGPESDPHSVLGFAKWLIKEIKMTPKLNADKE